LLSPRIAITMGDPCGVGPEIIVKALSSPLVQAECETVVIGDQGAVERACQRLGIPLHLQRLSSLDSRVGRPGSCGLYAPVALGSQDIAFGRPSARTALAIPEWIRQAVDAVLTGHADAVCTCPIHKANLYRHGFAFPGHTEFLAHLTETRNFVMMLAGPRLRVALATIHHPLAAVPRLITGERLLQTIRITGEALRRDFGLTEAHLAIAGLNPHAGEGGQLGREEVELLEPLIMQFRSASYRVSGPYAPDTVFHRAHEGEFDAVVALYHDQGLIPVKLVHFHDAVNVTLGLPIVRTSVDHGTAYDIAGTGRADPRSLIEAIRLAVRMVRNRAEYRTANFS
jgi:4-hydroxythreonine-4-phosphate dehydrogenase